MIHQNQEFFIVRRLTTLNGTNILDWRYIYMTKDITRYEHIQYIHSVTPGTHYFSKISLFVSLFTLIFRFIIRQQYYSSMHHLTDGL